jgi:hypothetical protein
MLRKTSALVVAAVITAGVTAHGAQQGIYPPSVPSNIAVDPDFNVFLAVHAVGTQNFICAPANTATGVDWLFIGPQATGYDIYGEQVLTHFLSKNPEQNNALHATWQHSRDSSVVWAIRSDGSLDPAFVAPGAIEWLRLEVRGARLGSSSGHKLSDARYIQRVHTVGGVKPPANECTAATLNNRRLVYYEADYYFYR